MTMMIWLHSAGQTFFRAGLRMTWRRVCHRLNASDSAASSRPFGMEMTPARMISVEYAPRLRAMARKDASPPVSLTPIVGRPKKMK